MVDKGSFLEISALSYQEQHINRWGECFFTDSTVGMPRIGFSLMTLTMPRSQGERPPSPGTASRSSISRAPDAVLRCTAWLPVIQQAQAPRHLSARARIT